MKSIGNMRSSNFPFKMTNKQVEDGTNKNPVPIMTARFNQAKNKSFIQELCLHPDV